MGLRLCQPQLSGMRRLQQQQQQQQQATWYSARPPTGLHGNGAFSGGLSILQCWHCAVVIVLGPSHEGHRHVRRPGARLDLHAFAAQKPAKKAKKAKGIAAAEVVAVQSSASHCIMCSLQWWSMPGVC